MVRAVRCARAALLVSLLLLASCAGEPKKVVAPAAPPPPVQALAIKVGQPSRYFLSMVPGRSQPLGVALSYALVDRYNKLVLTLKTRVGSAFQNGSVVAGRATRWPLTIDEGGGLRVAGGPRPGALDTASQLALVQRAQLLEARRCERHSFTYKIGMPIPADINFTPNHGDVVEHVRCIKHLADHRLRDSFRFERVADQQHAWLSFALRFNRDYEPGVVVEAAVVDASGKVHPSCKLRIAQPTVWEGQLKRYALKVTGVPLASVVRAIDSLSIRRIVPQTAMDRFVDVRLRCSGISGEQSGRGAPSDAAPRSPSRRTTILR